MEIPSNFFTATARHRRNFGAAARHGTARQRFFIAVPRHIFSLFSFFLRTKQDLIFFERAYLALIWPCINVKPFVHIEPVILSKCLHLHWLKTDHKLEFTKKIEPFPKKQQKNDKPVFSK